MDEQINHLILPEIPIQIFFRNGIVKFDQKIKIPLSEDSHLIVVAYGSNFDLKTGYGSSGQSSIRPCAYNNPIFVDLDGDGFTPNGDSLGYPLPTGRISLAEAKKLLSELEVPEN